MVSLIIPSYNRCKLLYNTLNKFLNDESINYEIIVVDQSENQDSQLIDLIKTHSDKIRYFNIKIKGLPHARNYGISVARGDFVVFCDDDVIPKKDFVLNHVRNFKEMDVGGVGGRVLVGNEDETVYGKLRDTGVFREWDGKFTDNFSSSERQYVDHVQGCNMSFRKEVIIQAGGFDENFRGSAHLEETDLCLRIRNMGYKIVFDPCAGLIHLKDTGGGCRAENYHQWFYWFGHNYMLFFLKNCRSMYLPLFMFFRVVWLLASAVKRLNVMIIIWGLQGYLAGMLTFLKNRNNCLPAQWDYKCKTRKTH